MWFCRWDGVHEGDFECHNEVHRELAAAGGRLDHAWQSCERSGQFAKNIRGHGNGGWEWIYGL